MAFSSGMEQRFDVRNRIVSQLSTRRNRSTAPVTLLAEFVLWEGSPAHGIEREVVLLDVTEEEAVLGFKKVDCPDCEGVGLIPWLPWDEIDECIPCKGTGKIYINV